MNHYQRQRNNAVKKLIRGNPVHINTYSTDCDGCSKNDSLTINTVQELIDFEKGFDHSLEWADGPMGYNFCEKEEMQPYYCGGSWSAY